MNIATIRGVLAILSASAAPFVAWSTGDTSLRAAVTLSLVAALGSAYTWSDSALTEAREKRASRRRMSQ